MVATQNGIMMICMYVLISKLIRYSKQGIGLQMKSRITNLIIIILH